MTAPIRHVHRMCSTPFGIEEGITQPNSANGSDSRVLNAFRHRRRNHNQRLKNGTSSPECSTPFGIEEGITKVEQKIDQIKD